MAFSLTPHTLAGLVLSGAHKAAVHPKGTFFAAASSGNSLKIFKRAGSVWNWLRTNTTVFQSPNAMQWSPDGGYIVAVTTSFNAAPEFAVMAFDEATGATTLCSIVMTTALNTSNYNIEWHPSGNYFVMTMGAGGTDINLIVLMKKTGPAEFTEIQRIADSAGCRAAAWSLDGTRLYLSRLSGTFLFGYSFASDVLTALAGTPFDTQPPSRANAMAINPIDQTLMMWGSAISGGVRLYVWNASANGGLGQYQLQAQSVDATSYSSNQGAQTKWSSDGKHFAVSLSATTPFVKIWDWDLAGKVASISATQISPTLDGSNFGALFVADLLVLYGTPGTVNTGVNVYGWYQAVAIAANGLLPTTQGNVNLPHRSALAANGLLPTASIAAAQKSVKSVKLAQTVIPTQPATGYFFDMSEDGKWLVIGDGTSSGKLVTMERVNGLWVTRWTSGTSFTPANKTKIKFSPDGNKVAISNGVTAPAQQILSLDKATGILTLDTIAGTLMTAANQTTIEWHPNSQIVCFSGNNATPYARFYKYNSGTSQWEQLGSDVTDTLAPMIFSRDGLRLIRGTSGAMTAHSFNVTTGMGAALATAFDTAPVAASIFRAAVFLRGGVEYLIITRGTAPYIQSYIWDPTANSGVGQYKVRNVIGSTLTAIPSRLAVGLRGDILFATQASPTYLRAFDVNTGGVLAPALDQPDVTGITAGLALYEVAGSFYDIMLSLGGVGKITPYMVSDASWSDLQSYLPTAAGAFKNPSPVIGALSSYLPTAAGVFKNPVPINGAMAGYLPTVVGTLNLKNKITAALAGYLPTVLGSAKQTFKATSALAGYLPTVAGSFKNPTPVTGVLVGYLPTVQGVLRQPTTGNGVLLSYLPTVVGAFGEGYPIAGVLVGYLPTIVGQAKMVPKVTGAMVGYLPTVQGALSIEEATALDLAGLLVGILPRISGSINAGAGPDPADVGTDYLVLPADTWTRVGAGRDHIRIQLFARKQIRVRLAPAGEDQTGNLAGLLIGRDRGLANTFEIANLPSDVACWVLAPKELAAGDALLTSY